jgi:hypothetical protein
MPRSRVERPCLGLAMVAVLLAPPSAAQANGCAAGDHKYPEAARVEAYRVTGTRTRTPVPVYVVCRAGTWVWRSTGEAVTRIR